MFLNPISGEWMETAVLRLADVRSYDNFGSALSVSDRGVMVGASGADEPFSSSGAVFVRTRG